MPIDRKTARVADDAVDALPLPLLLLEGMARALDTDEEMDDDEDDGAELP